MRKMLVICGPTATGKTNIALFLAECFGGELISADSRQVYTGMDTGTGKDVKKFKTQTATFKKKDNRFFMNISYKNTIYAVVPYIIHTIPVWMYDVVRPDEEFSVAVYQHLAKKVIASIILRNHLPIIAGGTGLYIRSLISGIDTAAIPPDRTFRRTAETLKLQELQNVLKKEDSTSWNIMNPSDRANPRRLIRKIEIALWNKNNQRENRNVSEEQDVLTIGLTAPRQYLYRNIDQRVDERVRHGVIREVETLLSKGYSWGMPSFNSMGYKEWKPYFEKHAPVSSIVSVWKNDEHGYARRQLTWFTKQKDVVWFDITKPGYQKNIETLVRSWYT